MIRWFLFTAALAGGLVATTAQATEVVTFQQGVDGYAAADDTYLQNNLGANGATSHVLVVRTGDDVFSTRNALVRFREVVGEEAWQVPAGATVESATLTLYTESQAGDEVTIHRMRLDWDPTTFTDDEAGNPNYAVGDPPVVQGYNSLDWVQAEADVNHPNGWEAEDLPTDTFLPASTETAYAIDVTADVQDWADGAFPNLGWVLLGTTENPVRFHSSDAGGVDEPKRPLLEVQYAPEPARGAMALAGAASLWALARRRRRGATAA